MRTITANTQSLLDATKGTEWLVLLEVEWVDDAPLLYSDQELAGARPILLSIGDFDGSMQISGSSDSQSMSVTLDDIDGHLREIYNSFDVHKRPARLYLLGKDLPLSDKVLIFRGETVTPIEWDAAKKSVSFNILTKLEEKQVGFSMEEGDFPNIPEEALGKAWPLVFGQVCHLPAVQVRAPRRGYLLQGTGIRDFTLDDRICQARQIQCPAFQTGPQDEYLQEANNLWSKTILGTIGPDQDCAIRRQGEICKLLDLEEQQSQYESDILQIWNGVNFPQGEAVTIVIEDAKFHGTFSGNNFTVNWREHPEEATFNHVECQKVPDMGYGKAAQDAVNLAARLRAIDSLGPGMLVRQWSNQGGGQITEITQEDIELMKIAAKQQYAPNDPDVQNNLAYQSAIAQIDAAYPSPGYYASGKNAVVAVDQDAIDWMKSRAESYWLPDETGSYFKNSSADDPAQALADCDWTLFQSQGAVGGPRDSWWYYDRMESADFFWAPAGSEVYLEGEEEIIYIASLIFGTVDSVAAYKTAPNGKRYLTEVPADLYTVWLQDYDGYYVVEIHMDKLLSQVNDDWDDQLYVSFTSTVGPNPCDVIEWIVNKYTDLTIDSTSFTTVKSDLTNYPTNFYLIDRPDALSLINDIAYQSRCAVYVRNDVLYIKYLSKTPSSERTISESDILFGSFKESLSQTEDLVTTHNISWKKAGASVVEDDSVDRKVILKYNVDKYGTLKEEYNYYCHNTYQMVEKTGTFWLIRKANSWKRISFKLPLKHIDLDVGDAITLDVEQFADPVKVVIESMQVDLDEHTIEFSCWSPIRAGETSAYYWAWPSQQSAAAIWPLAGDTHGGGGYNFDVTPPVDHLLTGGSHRDDQIIITTGELHPSDLDDSSPTVTCELSDYMDWEITEPSIEAKEIALSAARSSYGSTTQAGGGGGLGGPNNTNSSANKPEDDGECGTGAGCNYKVIVTWHKSHSQGQATSEGGSQPGGPCGGPCRCKGGCPSCFGPIWQVCHTFGSPGAAKKFERYMAAMYGQSETGDVNWWNCDEVRVLQTSSSNGQRESGCPDIDSSSTMAGGGETKKPVGLTGNEATATNEQSKSVTTVSKQKENTTDSEPWKKEDE